MDTKAEAQTAGVVSLLLRTPTLAAATVVFVVVTAVAAGLALAGSDVLGDRRVAIPLVLLLLASGGAALLGWSGERARRDEEEGRGDAPWPPHFPKQKSEPKRVQPSRDRDRPTQRGRVGDPQPGGPPPGVPGGLQRGFGSKPRTGQGYEHEFDD